MPRTASTIPNACIEQTAVVKKSTLSKEDEAKVEQLSERITDILGEAPFDENEESPWPQEEYEVGVKGKDGQNIAVVYIVGGTKKEKRRGPVAPDVVTAYEELFKEIEAEKSSKQQRHTV
ncbi:uncharacterized protein J4E78_008934 [Alternaria triticimaculans]|uniref:uncharacterized protein n=1 Tax=Alternaria triticimaculans TaxID=297637 RepID=UPI0020C2BD60|nr:uncharacterized protein J4E78_008934 [Alternaria triticimaculans]KAI4647618.1 hypothetical protein J4E78_008934 [Alternaria triticimaculans]